MAAAVHAVGTAVPPAVVTQPTFRDLLLRHPDLDGRRRRLLRTAFDASGIATRHTVLTELDDPAGPSAFYDHDGGRVLSPGTGLRNDLYRRSAPGLLTEAALDALTRSEIHPGEVTHLVTVSCTGFYAPGLDVELVARLGLDPTVDRYQLGFMGCSAALAGLRAARALVNARPGAVVLVACVELCSLHLQPPDDLDAILSAALFSDGAAVAVVSDRPPAPGRPVLQLDALRSELLASGSEEMTWSIGDRGFGMTLTSYVPRLLGENIEKVLAPLVDADPDLAGSAFAAIPSWAVHPGGRSILDKVQTALCLTEEQLAPSRAVLREFGNMSSTTVLFVLRALLDGTGEPGERICALAFGPGLTVESALLRRRVGA